MLSYDAPTFFPVTLEEVKNALRVDHDEWDARIVGTWIPAAVDYVETATQRSIVSRAHVWTLPKFPTDGRQIIRLPRGKTQSVTSVQYVLGGTTYTLTGPSSGSPAGTDYQERLTGDHGGILMPNQGNFWPSSDSDVPAPVTINFTAGWLAAEMPNDIRTMVLSVVSDLIDEQMPGAGVQGYISGWRVA